MRGRRKRRKTDIFDRAVEALGLRKSVCPFFSFFSSPLTSLFLFYSIFLLFVFLYVY